MVVYFNLYVDKSGMHRWNLKADNGKIVADSGEGYATAQSAREAAEWVKKNAPNAPIV